MKRKSNKKCPRGKISVTKKASKRKSYKRKDGTRVKASKVKGSTFCVKDRGAPGKGPKVIPPMKEGGLGGPGYLDKSSSARHKILDRCVKSDGYRTCLGRIQALSVLGKRTFSKADHSKLRGDREYLKRKYGGEGSFGPREKKRKKAANPGPVTNPAEIKRLKARCMRG